MLKVLLGMIIFFNSCNCILSQTSPPLNKSKIKSPQIKQKEKIDNIPKEIRQKFDVYVKQLKNNGFTELRTIEKKSNEFICERLTASEIKVYPERSDYVEKPYKIRLNWLSSNQQSKIYSTKEKAEKNTEWLLPGKIAGADKNIHYGQTMFNATFFYENENKEWKLHEIEWFPVFPENLIGGRPPVKIYSTKKGDKTLWLEFLEKINKK
jgi:hypothetical protein